MGEERSCLIYKLIQPLQLRESYTSGCATQNVCNGNTSLNFLNWPHSSDSVSCRTVSETPDLTPGHAIFCHICNSYNGDSCVGQLHQCSEEDDTCLYEKMKIIHERAEETEDIRRCGKSRECGRVGRIQSSRKTILINTTCCDHSGCHTPMPTLPSINNDENGVICPACFVPNADRCASYDNLKCTGKEKRCVRYMRTEKRVRDTLHGCTTDEICEAGSSVVHLPGRYYKSVINNISCTNAAPWRNTAPPLFMVTVTTLSVFKVEF
ncbi:phospholipase A2 inhibitor and Ly6/PLAUR domain-containing protein-like isoform X1 [Hyperolius riggenbachi]|uniref:phospholipase A2 inhibitor and Ly6/PLAUR domain-containing protein-like isoform X1 n=1 Tax=Hyperolius riggenbachi TaxID=752182 RepID=UPI0035A2CA46